MALFGGRRDVDLFISINKELINKIIHQEVDYYKLSLQETTRHGKEGLYGESTKQKVYYTAVRVPCLISRQDMLTSPEDQFGIDKNQLMLIKFLKQTLLEIQLVPQEGDIFETRGNYYEIDQVNQNQFVVGKDPDYAKGAGDRFGESLSMICSAHWTRVNKLQIIQPRA